MATNEAGVEVTKLSMESLFSMKGGDGENSYLNNSQAQARHARRVLPFLVSALKTLKLNPSPKEAGAFTIADLGCSTGTNTLFLVDVIVKCVAQMYEELGHDLPEFLVFFSDLPSNDFNVLFQLLPPPPSSGCLEGQRPYFASGVPGSFYTRLFPSRSVNVFNSFFSLHWLPQVPERVTDESSAAYNKGRVFVHGASMDTANAYKEQFQEGLAAFLRARATEMKADGVMFLVFIGRTSVDPTDQQGAGIFFGAHFQDAWNDLVQEGLLESEKRDSFNVPMYAASLEEVREVVEAEGSFAINGLRVVDGGSPLVMSDPEDADEVGRALVNGCRSVAGVLVESHIGERLSEELFARMERRAARHARELVEELQFFHIVASLSFAAAD
ncbi:hypothetical protein Cni_G03976 [Canna indica]|uniref:Uncharacterized protein n=1 Tax=Canna indica TaxID=4628 RepID=A0AAQ3JS62_9LILI|nr:hypothetical protein Cni_G03976 [Canna indica]